MMIVANEDLQVVLDACVVDYWVRCVDGTYVYVLKVNDNNGDPIVNYIDVDGNEYSCGDEQFLKCIQQPFDPYDTSW